MEVLRFFLLLVVCLTFLNEIVRSEDVLLDDSVPQQEDNVVLPVEDDLLKEEEFQTYQRKSSNPAPNRTSKASTDVKVDYEEELKIKHAEAQRQRKMDGRKQEGLTAVKRTIKAAATDSCDWKTQPVAFIKGEVCGSHYKVLGLDRRSKLLDKPKIKKTYRQLSLQLHPDKNPALNAEDAFNVLQGAYDCISDDECKDLYDQKLVKAEHEIFEARQKFKRLVIDKTTVALHHTHYYVSLAANRIYQTGMQFWDMMGEWQVPIFGEVYPLGRPLAVLMLLWKGQFLLKLHALSYLIIRVNFEIAKARGWL